MDNSANFEALKQATLGANAISAPTSTLGASNAPELAQLYQSTFQLPQSSGATAAHAQLASDVVAEQKAAAARAAAEAKQRAADMSDPKKYRAVKKDDGGYDFFDPNGNQVDIATLAKNTGTKPIDWVSDSENPIDIQYVQDYKNLQNLIQAVVSKDTKTIDSYKQSFKDSGIPDITQQKPHDIINQFQNYYQRYYVPRSKSPGAWGVTPNANPYVPAPSSGSSYGVGASSGGI